MPERTHERVASRELDALVAEKVMGWKICGRPFPGPGIWVNDGARLVGYIGGDHVPQWRPSEYISDAFQVVEKMRERRWRFSLGDVYGALGVRTGFNARFEEHDGTVMTGREVDAEADTAPRAIALAALKAVEGVAEDQR